MRASLELQDLAPVSTSPASDAVAARTRVRCEMIYELDLTGAEPAFVGPPRCQQKSSEGAGTFETAQPCSFDGATCTEVSTN